MPLAPVTAMGMTTSTGTTTPAMTFVIDCGADLLTAGTLVLIGGLVAAGVI